MTFYYRLTCKTPIMTTTEHKDCDIFPGVNPGFPERGFIHNVCGRVPWLYQYWPGGFMFLWFYVQEHQKAQPAVVLVLKPLKRLGNSLKSHLTDWEKPGIEPATPGLQDIDLSPTPRWLLFADFISYFLNIP